MVLTGPGWPAVLREAGLREDDAAAVQAVARRVVERRDSLAEVERLAGWLRESVGVFPGERSGPEWPGYDHAADPYGPGVLPLLALLVTTPDLVAFHRSRGVPEEVTAATLRELGQQVWVHRLTFGTFGLHTYGWLVWTWSGSLYWLGRLQFNLERLAGPDPAVVPDPAVGPDAEVEPDAAAGAGWVVSTHIPRSGPLDPESVEESLARAATFFPRHFPDRPVQDFWCSSWLLAPELADALDAGSNMARFQRRWHLYGEPMPGDEDALFFTFAHRGEVDLDALPQQTSLQRAIVSRLRAGGHWTSRQGRLPLAEVGPAAGSACR